MEKIMRINRINNFFSKIIFKCFNCQALSLFFFSILFPCFARADAPNPTDKDILNVFDNVDQSFLAIAKSWVDTGESYAKTIFFSLALLSIIIAGIKYVLYKQEIQEVFTGLVVKLISLCGFLTVIQYAPTWMDSIFLKSFESLGAHVTNINTLSPTGIVDQGFDLVVKILHATPPTSLFQVFNAAMVIISIIVIAGSFGYLGVELLVTKIQAYVVMYGCLCFFGFSGLSQVRFITYNLLKSALNVGIKIFMLYLVISAATKSTDVIISIIAGNTGYSPSITGLLIISTICVVYVSLVLKVKSMAHEFSMGVMSASASENISTATNMAMKAATLGKSSLAQKAGGMVGGAVSKGAANASAAVQTFRNGASRGQNTASKMANGVSNVVKNAKANVGQKASDVGGKVKDNFNSKKENSVFNDRNPPPPPKYY